MPTNSAWKNRNKRQRSIFRTTIALYVSFVGGALLVVQPFVSCFSIVASAQTRHGRMVTRNVGDMVAPEPPDHLKPIYKKNLCDEGGSSDDGTVLVKTPARMNYVSRTTVKAVIHRNPQGFDSDTEGAIWQEETVWVENGRLFPFALHPNGFELATAPAPTNIDFLNKDDVLDRYYPHCRETLERHLRQADEKDSGKYPASTAAAAVQVWCFDHNVRIQKSGESDVASEQASQKPLGLVHGDYTNTSAPRRLQLLAEPPKINDVWKDRLSSGDNSTSSDQPLLDPKVVQECIDGKRRYALINLWRSIDTKNPIASTPLACVDALTVDTSHDLRVLEVHYEDRIGENFLACPTTATESSTKGDAAAAHTDDSAHHRWVYYPSMVYDECLFIKQWDSSGDFARAPAERDTVTSTFALHSAFQDPTSPPDAPPRQSIEVRCVAIWEAEP